MSLPRVPPPVPRHLGLTGGIGSGKSTVCQMLADLGAGVIDADAISRQSTASRGAAIESIRAHFGPSAIDPQGAMDRAHMRQLCFSDPAARQALEAIIHPIVRSQALTQAEQWERHGKTLIVWDVPLLVETGHWRSAMDRVLVIDCPVDVQVHRVMARTGTGAPPMNEAQVRSIIASQASRAQRLACADFVIHNADLSLDELREQVAQIHMWWPGQARSERCESKL